MYVRLSRFIAVAALPALAACASLVDDRDTTFLRTRKSDDGKFIVAMRPLVEPLPVNQIHSWAISLTTPTGAPVSNAVFFIGGGMPDHGHGFPTSPRVVAQSVAGSYMLEGMKFSMNGRWEIKFAIQAAEVSDMVTFNTMVELPAVRK